MRTLLLACACLLSTSDLPALEQEAVRRAVESGSLQPLEQILAAVQAQHPGRVIDVELERLRDGRPIYEIELLGDDGRRMEFHVDARSGRLLDRAASATVLRPLSAILREVLERYPGQIVSIDLDRERYEIELLNAAGDALRISVDAVSGALADDAAAARRPARLLPLPGLLEQLARSHPGTVVEVELERDVDGQRYYEIDIRDAQGGTVELRIDAVSGEPYRGGD